MILNNEIIFVTSNLSAKKFGMLTAIRPIKKIKNKTIWEFICDQDKIKKIGEDYDLDS